MPAAFAISTTRGGKAILKAAGVDWVEGLVTAVQPDGKILVGGTMNFNPLIGVTPWNPANGFDGSGHFIPHIMRYTATGELDVTFGVGGLFILDFPAITDHFDAEVTDIKIRSDGAILFAFLYYAGGVSSGDGAGLLTATGVLDPTFATNGVLIRQHAALTYNPINRIAFLSDGSFVLAGSVAVPQRWIACAKYTAAGVIVSAFGSSGVYSYADATDDCQLTGLHVDGSDNIYLLGQWGNFGSPQQFIVIKIDGTGGALVNAFGTSGVIKIYFGHDGETWPLAQFLEQGSNLIVGGWSAYNVGGNTALCLARFAKATGVLDNTFGTNGKTIAHGGPQVNDQSFGRLFFDASGKIILAGQSCSAGSVWYTITQSFLVARYSADGAVDTAFGSSGFLTIDIDGSGNQDTYGGGLDANGNYLFSGHCSGENGNGGGGAKGFVIRTSSAGVLDTAFGQLSGFAYGTAPSVTTGAASAVAATTTTANATINPQSSPTYWRFVYGKASGKYHYRSDAALVGAGSSGVAVTASLTGLTSGTAYYGRAIAYSGKGGHAVGAEITWTTS